jgi:hypothetical protein
MSRQFAAQAATYFKRPHTVTPTHPLDHPAAWYGYDMAGRSHEWLIHFTHEDVQRLESTARNCLQQGLSLADLSASNFPIGGVHAKLATGMREVSQGRGFCVFRGLPVQRWGEDLTSLVYWGMAQHLGSPGVQNPQGEQLGHVKDYGEGPGMQRLYRTKLDIGFHCDGAQAVGLLCLNAARSGGQSRIASSVTVFNELVQVDPGLASRLFRPIFMDRRDEQPAGEAPCTPIQPGCYDPPYLRTFYHSEYFRSAQRHPGYEPDQQTMALLDQYDAIANTPGVFLDMWLRPGDFQLISNYTIIHARTEYEDFDAPERKRHLLRLWLNFHEHPPQQEQGHTTIDS